MIVRLQAETNWKMTIPCMNKKRNCKKICFHSGMVRYKSIGAVLIWLSPGSDHFENLMHFMIFIDGTLLLGLNFIKRLQLITNFAKFTLQNQNNESKVPLVTNYSYLYLWWLSNVFYTTSKPKHTHRHFYHSSTEKLCVLIKRASPNALESNLCQTLIKVQTLVIHVQETETNHTVSVSLLPKTTVFNQIRDMNFMEIHSSTLLHIIDRNTTFLLPRSSLECLK